MKPAKGAPVVQDLPPLLPPNASPTLTFTLREYSRQYNVLTWALTSQLALFFFLPVVALCLWVFGQIASLLFPGGIFIFGFFELVLFLMAIYAFFQRPALRRKVAESGIDPDLWQAHVSRDFWRVANPICKVVGIVIGGIIALGTVTIISGIIYGKVTEGQEKARNAASETYPSGGYYPQATQGRDFPGSYSQPVQSAPVVVPQAAYQSPADVNAAANEEALRAQAVARQQQEYMARAAQAQARQSGPIEPPSQPQPYILQKHNTSSALTR